MKAEGYLELGNVYLDYEFDGNITLKGVWLELGDKELDITDFLTSEDWQRAQQQAIEDYAAKCQDAQDRIDEAADRRYQAWKEER